MSRRNGSRRATTPSPYVTVKLSPNAHAAVKRLAEAVSVQGWIALGADRAGPPTIAAVVEEAARIALERLAAPLREPSV